MVYLFIIDIIYSNDILCLYHISQLLQVSILLLVSVFKKRLFYEVTKPFVASSLRVFLPSHIYVSKLNIVSGHAIKESYPPFITQVLFNDERPWLLSREIPIRILIGLFGDDPSVIEGLC